ncbi:MAG: hypothetical protein P0S95_04705 [Rhabdochlamydiaceae bacterium]|nr:hypothetical protein [Candidatus Amphrikana amoebophyrae]
MFSIQARLRDGSTMGFQDLLRQTDRLKILYNELDWTVFFDLAEKSHDCSYTIEDSCLGKSCTILQHLDIIDEKGNFKNPIFEQVVRNSTMRFDAPDLGYRIIDPNFRPPSRKNSLLWDNYREKA